MWGTWQPRFTYFLDSTRTNTITSSHKPLSYHLIFLFFFSFVSLFSENSSHRRREQKIKIKMALQIPTKSMPLPSFLTPTGNAGLRRASDAFALKSSFFSPSVHLLLPARPRYAARATAPKISMRLASKQAYICRDCGYFLHQFLFFLFFFIFLRNFDLIVYFL